jgi:Fe-S-cluster-containing hydrogenase component 2
MSIILSARGLATCDGGGSCGGKCAGCKDCVSECRFVLVVMEYQYPLKGLGTISKVGSSHRPGVNGRCATSVPGAFIPTIGRA